ncbi:hypothetical protein A5674_11160 [Mycobacterium malmoense]|uniref:DUF732 domain-containing protein n=1 Tax=Mycobacterium malmoense TaxID=1780 RepID=UPI00080B5931|nr:DUF732 domain-containing protein [Mycobacterium malmoense]OCB18010.1 hypothetical protein A5674_11160 [Mycobacterium malmoense]
MRDRETIDAELRRIASGRRSVRERGGESSSRELDELLDELLAHTSGSSLTHAATACEPEVRAAGTLSRGAKTGGKPRRRHGVPRQLGLLAALPLSLVAVAAAGLVMLGAHNRDSSAQPAEKPPSVAPPTPVAPPKPVAPQAPASRIAVADAAFIAALKHEGVPMPSQEYAMTQGHAVCDFLANRPNFADAVDFVQRSSIWDANQSAQVTAGSIVAYCPQSQPATPAAIEPAYQNALSDLQAIEGQLQGIQGDLQNIRGDLQGIPGQP